jgi:hypothetical protein
MYEIIHGNVRVCWWPTREEFHYYESPYRIQFILTTSPDGFMGYTVEDEDSSPRAWQPCPI